MAIEAFDISLAMNARHAIAFIVILDICIHWRVADRITETRLLMPHAKSNASGYEDNHDDAKDYTRLLFIHFTRRGTLLLSAPVPFL